MSDKLVDRLEKAIRKTIDAEAQNHQGTELEWFEGLEEALDLIAEFRMPDKRWRDADNLLAMIKSGIDGVCDATGINDRDFRRVTVDRVMDGGGIVRLTIRGSNA